MIEELGGDNLFISRRKCEDGNVPEDTFACPRYRCENHERHRKRCEKIRY
jgi:hypothetical protein